MEFRRRKAGLSQEALAKVAGVALVALGVAVIAWPAILPRISE